MSANLARDLEVATEDGTLIRGVIVSPDPVALKDRLTAELGVPASLMEPFRDKLLIAPWVLEEISSELLEESYISEVYPTWDALEVERTPLDRMRAPN
jgi:hypothetical protein